MQLDGAHVLITGGSRGIGAGLASAFHAAGARLTLTGRDAAALTAVAAPLDATTLVADLLDRDARRALVSRVEDAHGPVDVLVNNAGWEGSNALDAMDADALEGLYVLNALTPAELCRQAIPGMIARGRGHIVNIASMAATAAFPGLVPYSSTKAALSHLTSGLRNELRGLPIGTTLVEVAFVTPTAMVDRAVEYDPLRLAKRRFDRLGLLADVRLERLCAATVSAVAAERRHVRLPRRAWMFSALPEAPRRMTEWILAGVGPRQAG